MRGDFVLAVLLLGDVFPKFALGGKQPPVYDLERFVMLRLGQRASVQRSRNRWEHRILASRVAPNKLCAGGCGKPTWRL